MLNSTNNKLYLLTGLSLLLSAVSLVLLIVLFIKFNRVTTQLDQDANQLTQFTDNLRAAMQRRQSGQGGMMNQRFRNNSQNLNNSSESGNLLGL